MKVLTRVELKDIKGGSEDAGSCLYCIGDGGACGSYSEDCYYRKDTGSSAEMLCQSIYPGCTTRSGYWAVCEGQCQMN